MSSLQNYYARSSDETGGSLSGRELLELIQETKYLAIYISVWHVGPGRPRNKST